jgi:hypothetical protein
MAHLCVEQRLLPEPIPRKHDLAATVIPKREREHAVETLDEARALVLVEVWKYFRIASRAKHMPARDELVSQLAEVVDLTVLDGHDRPVFVPDRLVTAGNVDDAQSADTKDRTGRTIYSFIVRSSMSEHGEHSPHLWPSGSVCNGTSDPTHGPRIARLCGFSL